MGSTMAPSPEETTARAAADRSADSDSEDMGICFVRKKILSDLRNKVKSDAEITRDDVDALAAEEFVDPEEIMVPIDTANMLEDMEDMNAMVEKLGAKGVAEAFIAAEDRFQANKDKIAEEVCPKPMTAKEWKSLAEMEDPEEEGFECGEEEDLEEDAEEEIDDDGAAEEPATKKPKTA